jgi:hypothetical protein
MEMVDKAVAMLELLCEKNGITKEDIEKKMGDK